MGDRDLPFATEVLPVDLLDLAPHSNAVACVLAGRRGPVAVDDGARRVIGDAVLVRPGIEHRVRCAPGGAAALYLDGLDLGDRLPFASALKGSMATFALRAFDDDEDARRRLRAELASGPSPCPPPIADILNRLRADPMQRMSQVELAGRLGMERTRALRCFKAATGQTFRAYKKWIGLKFAARQLLNGESVRTAALDAGYSDTAHLSRTFRAIFGMRAADAVAALRRSGH